MEKKELLSQLKVEHDSISMILMRMSTSLMMEDVDQFRRWMKQFDQEAGPHFRFDEEAVYPSLVDIYYPGYITKLYTDHDLAIARYNQLKQLFSKEHLTENDYYEAIRHVRMIAQYIDNCEILPVRNIPLNNQQIKRIATLHRKARIENLSLVNWADTRRRRRHLYFI